MFDPVIFIAQLSMQKLGVFPLNIFFSQQLLFWKFP